MALSDRTQMAIGTCWEIRHNFRYDRRRSVDPPSHGRGCNDGGKHSAADFENRPLTSAALHILIALTESDLQGYAIMQSVKRQSNGSCRLGPGTLYANLDRLLANGWVGESQCKLDNGNTRREYHLTPSGKQVLRLEVRRLRQVVDIATKTVE